MSDDTGRLAEELGRINRPALSGGARDAETGSWMVFADALLASRWLAARVAAARAEGERAALRKFRVEVVQHYAAPTTCKVWRDGRLVFNGQDCTAALRAVGDTTEAT